MPASNCDDKKYTCDQYQPVVKPSDRWRLYFGMWPPIAKVQSLQSLATNSNYVCFYSMEGSVPRLGEIIALKKRYKVLSIYTLCTNLCACSSVLN